MTKYEFLEKMRRALANDLSSSAVQENVSYYDGYINEEVRKGRSEEAVTEELGDPWAIARSIIEVAENSGNMREEYTYDSGQQVYGGGQQQRGNHVHVFRMDSWWRKLLLVMGIMGVVMVITAVIGGIFSLLAPLIVPFLLIMLIVRIIGGRRR